MFHTLISINKYEKKDILHIDLGIKYHVILKKFFSDF